MRLVNSLLDRCKRIVQKYMNVIARMLDSVSGGKITPNLITLTGLLAHLGIAWLIADGQYVLSAALLVFFGLFDALDGALARLQKRDGPAGMLLDSITDRMKEVILYIGIAYAFINTGHYAAVVWAVAACGASLLVSYTNAWSEVVLIGKRAPHQINQSFRSGLMRFEVRMVVLILGLLSDRLIEAVALVAVLSFVTAVSRLQDVIKRLDHVQD